jgi:hypothetical protein
MGGEKTNRLKVMAAYGTIQELKNAINASIYANDAGLLTAEVLQERLHDIIDTLNALAESVEGNISALESANDLAQIYAGDDKVATEAWVGEQDFISSAEKGANNGVAELDSGGKVPLEQLPDYIDDNVIGNRLYTENNILTDSETLTASLDKLDKAVVLNTKIIEIGNWNMDSIAVVDVPIGIDFKRVRNVSVLIRNDADDNYFDFVSAQAGAHATAPLIRLGVVTAVDVVELERNAGGYFDGSNFDSDPPYNRGWVTIQYTP